jgi:hypothetical protein
MWLQTDVLLWPLRGWLPGREDVSDWLEQMLKLLRTDRYTYVSETVGAAAVAALLTSLLKRRRLRQFIQTGWMSVGLAEGEKRTQ